MNHNLMSKYMNNRKINLFHSSEIRMRSKADSSKYQDDFEVYVQALISQSLDTNFLEEVYADKGNELDHIYVNINIVLQSWTH